MKTKKKNPNMVILIIIVIIVVGCIILNSLIKTNRERDESNINVTQNEENIVEEFVRIGLDGTKTNISNKLKEEKTIDGCIVKDITIQTKYNETVLQAIVVNPSNKVKGDYEVKLKVKDKNGNVIKEIAGYISTINANGQTNLKIKTSYDFANAYDFEIIKAN